MSLDLGALFAEADKFEKDPAGMLSMEALSGRAIRTLLDSLTNASSEDVKRKAAVDILNLTKGTKTNTPAPTEAELEFLGRVIVEAEAIRFGGERGEGSPRVAESVS